VSWPEKACVGCGARFTPSRRNQTRCKPDCSVKRSSSSKNGARTRERELHEVEFIAVDGEGVTRPKYRIDYDPETGEEITVRCEEDTHDYVLLSVGDKSLHKNGKELTHDEIFSFLWEQFEANPNGVFVGFALGYDFTMWMKSFDESVARSLLTKEGISARQPMNSEMRFPFPVRDGGIRYTDEGTVYASHKWEFDILGFKRFKLRPYVKAEDVPTKIVTHKDGTQEEVKVSRPWMYICDVFPFFQSSFLKAIKPEKGAKRIVSDEEYARIAQGKEIRSGAQFDEAMIEYNLLENEVLARLMSVLNEGFVSDNIRLTRQQWMGPGQAAQEWMKLVGVPSGEEVREVTPEWALEAGRKCYYGGWFEIFNHGPVPGTSYAYDINSAYPAVIAQLPCLLHGRWTKGEGKPGRLRARSLRMVYGTFSGKDDWVGPLPYRSPEGNILRPMRVKGWYWWHEVQASIRAGLTSRVEIEQWIEYEPCKCDPPMRGVRELYNGRLKAGKNTPQGKAKKLVYNSAYGKCAQSIGKPRFSNSIWASLITAGCRTQILDAIATHPTKSASLLMIATDGIVFKEPHPHLDIDGERLGAWDEETYENLSLFMPGLYWHDKAREQIREGSLPQLKSRGVSAKYLGTVIDQVDRMWKEYDGEENPIPRVSLNIDWALIGAKQAITRNSWHLCGTNVWDAERILDANPSSKRQPSFTNIPEIAWGGLRSWPWNEREELETTYYEPRFGAEDSEDRYLEELVTPDGMIGDLQAHAFGLR
jgi:DNA polymerase family B